MMLGDLLTREVYDAVCPSEIGGTPWGTRASNLEYS